MTPNPPVSASKGWRPFGRHPCLGVLLKLVEERGSEGHRAGDRAAGHIRVDRARSDSTERAHAGENAGAGRIVAELEHAGRVLKGSYHRGSRARIRPLPEVAGLGVAGRQTDVEAEERGSRGGIVGDANVRLDEVL